MTTAYHFTPVPTKTYATKANAIKAVEKVYGPNCDIFATADVRYVVMQTDEGRFLPLFIGQNAANHGVGRHFNIIA